MTTRIRASGIGDEAPVRKSGMADIELNIDGRSIPLRVFVEVVPVRIQYGVVASSADPHSIPSSVIEIIVDRIRGLIQPKEESEDAQLVLDERVLSRKAIVPPMQSILRVGPLELDLLDRVVKRQDRKIDLRPREFGLLKYMMERSGVVLTRSALLRDVWHYRFVPKTNLVDVHMCRLRRKVDGVNDPPMINSIRGVGFVLNAISSESGSGIKSVVVPKKCYAREKELRTYKPCGFDTAELTTPRAGNPYGATVKRNV